MTERKTLKISNLVINVKNPRHEAVEQEQEAMEFLMSEDFEGMYNLANSIVANGYFPAQILSVLELKDKEGFFVLLDGNRRMTSIKILTNPEIIPDSQQFSRFKNAIKTLSDSWETKVSDFECVVYDKKEDADAYLLSIHTDDKNFPGPKKWNRIQQDRFKEESDGEVSFAYKVITKNLPSIDITTIKNLSTIDRILKTGEVKNNLLKFDTDGNSSLDKTIIEPILNQIIIDSINANKYFILGNDKVINTRLTKNEIVEYINILLNKIRGIVITPTSVTPAMPTNQPGPTTSPTGTNTLTPPMGLNGSGTGAPTTGGSTLPVGSKRTKIKGYNGLAFEFIEAKAVDNTNLANKGILEICNELKLISNSKTDYYKQFPIATATLIRALLEQSLKYSLREKGLWNNITNNGTIPEGKIGLQKLIDFCGQNKPTIFPDGTISRCFDTFANNNGTKDYFDMTVHHPARVQSNPDVLKDIANCGLYDFIYYILN